MSPRVRLVTPDGKLREITERDNPEEMQLIRSSYGLFGIVYEVTIKVRPTTALAVRHYSLSLDNFRRYFPIYKARGYAVMYYIFPYVKRVLVELRKDNPDAQPNSRHRWVYRNRFWRKYGPAVTLWIERSTKNAQLRSLADKLHFFVLRQALVLVVRSDRTWPHAQIINYPRDPGANKYLFSMWAFRERGLLRHPRGILQFLPRLREGDRLSLRPAERGLFHRARRRGACCPIAGKGATLEHRPGFDRRPRVGGIPASLQ